MGWLEIHLISHPTIWPVQKTSLYDNSGLFVEINVTIRDFIVIVTVWAEYVSHLS